MFLTNPMMTPRKTVARLLERTIMSPRVGFNENENNNYSSESDEQRLTLSLSTDKLYWSCSSDCSSSSDENYWDECWVIDKNEDRYRKRWKKEQELKKRERDIHKMEEAKEAFNNAMDAWRTKTISALVETQNIKNKKNPHSHSKQKLLAVSRRVKSFGEGEEEEEEREPFTSNRYSRKTTSAKGQVVFKDMRQPHEETKETRQGLPLGKSKAYQHNTTWRTSLRLPLKELLSRKEETQHKETQQLSTNNNNNKPKSIKGNTSVVQTRPSSGSIGSPQGGGSLESGGRRRRFSYDVAFAPEILPREVDCLDPTSARPMRPISCILSSPTADLRLEASPQITTNLTTTSTINMSNLNDSLASEGNGPFSPRTEAERKRLRAKLQGLKTTFFEQQQRNPSPLASPRSLLLIKDAKSAPSVLVHQLPGQSVEAGPNLDPTTTSAG
jgi:hypothetical protein